MYGLVKLIEESGAQGAYRRAFELARDIFQYPLPGEENREVRIEYDEAASAWRVTMPREALVGFGRKPRPGRPCAAEGGSGT